MPSRSLAIQAQVTGLTTYVSEQLVPGGLVPRAMKSYASIPVTTDLPYGSAKPNGQCEVILKQEESRQAVAKREWKILGTGVKGSTRGRRLAMREPQILSAKAGIDAAKSSLAGARLALARTKITAPFNAVVRTENIEIGQRIGPGQPLATLVGTDHWWVQVSIPIKALKWLKIPGSAVTLSAPSTENKTGQRRGRVLRTLPDVDRGSQMARILVEVPDPLGLSGDKAPLLLGSTVQVRMQGKDVQDVLSIPREALRRGNEVWLVDQNNQLVNRTVKIVWRERTHLLVTGIKASDRVISSALAGGTPGMKLRVIGDPDSTIKKAVDTESRTIRPQGKQARAQKENERRTR